MKQLFIIRPHSVIDVITNSSSELFVIHGRKSIDAVKEIIESLIEVNNKAADDSENGQKTSFGNAFNEEIKQIETKEEAEELFMSYHHYMLNNHSIFAQMMGAEHKYYENDEIKKMLKNGEIDISRYVKVGDITVYSAEDNSIPWPIVESMEGMFSCERYHLG